MYYTILKILVNGTAESIPCNNNTIVSHDTVRGKVSTEF